METEGKSMRPLVILISSILITGSQAQNMLDHGAAMSGAAIGAAAGKPMSDAITKIFGKTEADTAKAAKTPAKTATTTTKPAAKLSATPALPETTNPSQPVQHSQSARTSSVYYRTPTAPVIAQPVALVAAIKEPSVEELASIKEGASEKEMIAVLGQPGSRVTVPDDDGHLRETCQYWSKGQQIGTIRLDNGQVVTVQARN
jgi:hypothetical protein